MITRQTNESFISLCLRATHALKQKEISYQEWINIVAGSVMYSDETLRRISNVFDKFLNMLVDEELSTIQNQELKDFVLQQQQQLVLEKKKIQTENVQLQEQYRNLARTELLYEQITNAIAELEPIQVKQFQYTKPVERTGLLCLADQHFDSNFEIKGVFGEVVNSYNKDIFYARMWNLLAKMDADRFDYDKLVIVCMGDCVEGLIRMTSLQKLRQPVVKSVVQFAEFMSQWLKETSDRLGIPIDFAMVGGNHGVSRFLTQKPEFKEENLEYIIHAFIKLRLENEPNINIIDYDDVYFTAIHNTNILFAHGENSDLESLMTYCENLYQITIDRCYGAHFHNESVKSIGVADVGSRMVIRVPSICGTDTYAKSIRKHNRAGCYFAVFSDDGEEFNKIYYLN